MEIQLSPAFTEIAVLHLDSDAVVIQCGLWPSWSDLHAAAMKSLNAAQVSELEQLFRSEHEMREFEIENEVLTIRLANALTI